MGFGGPFSSSSENRQRTVNADQSNTAGDQAVVYAPRNSGNPRNSLRLGRGASYQQNTYVTQQGVDADKFDSAIAALTASRSSGGSLPDSSIDNAIANRLKDNVEQGSPSETETRKVNWIVLGSIGLVLVVGA